MEDKVTVGAILSRSFALLGSAPVPAGAAFAAMTLLWLGSDLSAEMMSFAFTILAMVGSIAAQYMLTSTLLERLGTMPEDQRRGRVASFVGAGIVTGIGIGLGLLLFVVPGLYLLARWSVVTPLIIGEGLTMDDAMRESGRRAEGSGIAIAVAFVLISLPWFVSVGLFALTESEAAPISPFATILISDVLMAVTNVVAWCCCVAVYDLTRPRS